MDVVGVDFAAETLLKQRTCGERIFCEQPAANGLQVVECVYTGLSYVNA
jgi:hypothetical protein